MPAGPPLPEEREGFRFRGGHRALDLATTLAGRLKPVQRELLAVPADLDRWLGAAMFSPSTDAAAEDLAMARRLREAVYAMAIAEIGGKQDPASAELNAIARLPATSPQLGEGKTVTWEGSATALVAALAREAVLLFGGVEPGRIRQCDAEGCAILFLDTSRSGDRRWCSMSGCGNKAKVAEFRRRRRAASGNPGSSE
jgi:predicted RNA-binding Zn ribbon-like protein